MTVVAWVFLRHMCGGGFLWYLWAHLCYFLDANVLKATGNGCGPQEALILETYFGLMSYPVSHQLWGKTPFLQCFNTTHTLVIWRCTKCYVALKYVMFSWAFLASVASPWAPCLFTHLFGFFVNMNVRFTSESSRVKIVSEFKLHVF